MIAGKGLVTQTEYQKHIGGNWRTAHGIWEKIRNYVPGFGYSKAEVDALLDALLPDTIANVLTDHDKAAHDALGLSHDSLVDVSVDDHHAQLHAAEHEVGGGDLVNHDALTNFVANKHIDHTGVTLTAGIGLTGGGTIAANRTFNVDVGIGDDKIVQMDDADAADNDYAKFTANGLEGRSYAEVLADLSTQAGAAFSWNSQNLTSVGTIGCGTITVVDGSSINLQEDITFTGATTENKVIFPDNLPVALDFTEAGNSYWKFVSTNAAEKVVVGKTLELSTVINAGADVDKFLVLDAGDIVDFRTGAEVLADLSGDAGAAFSWNSQNLTNIGTISAGQATFADATIADDARGLSSIFTLSADPAKSDGIALYAEGHIGAITTDGSTDGAGIWLNIDSGAILGADVRALDIGIYERDADCRGGNAYGLAIHLDFDVTNPPAAIYPFRLNTNVAGATPDALIFAANKSALGVTEGTYPFDNYLKAVVQDGTVYRIPVVTEGSENSMSFTGATTENKVIFPDNLPDAFSFKEGANFYQTFVTTNGSEAVQFHKNIIVPDGGTIGNTTAIINFDETNSWLEITGKVGIGTATIPHGGVGIAVLAFDGPNNSAVGPHVQFTTDFDTYPLLAIYPRIHNNIAIYFDSYLRSNLGAHLSSHAGSNYAIFKTSNLFKVVYDSGIGQGDSLTWNDGIILDINGNFGIGTSVFGINAVRVQAMLNGTAPTTSLVDTSQMWSADVLGVAGKAGPHQRSEEKGMKAWHGGAGTINNFTYQADIADDGSFTLPAITDSAWGFVQAGNNEEYAFFTIDDDGDVILISNSANVVANADTDGKICLGIASPEEPLTIKNRLGATKNINLIIWYS